MTTATRQASIFDQARSTLEQAIEQTADSLNFYGQQYKHWKVAYSGGKDSTALVTLLAHLIESGRVTAPESIEIFMADTKQELPPLMIAAMKILSQLRDRGFKTTIVLPEMDHRYFVYILGRGVCPPSNVFRWCTPKLKQMPMAAAMERGAIECGEKFLMLTGVRVGESAARDQRIAVSCTKDGGECGQGWMQREPPKSAADTLAPLLHWRVCHVWDWLTLHAPSMGFDTWDVAEFYGATNSDGEEPLAARTGCMGCPLVQEDAALDRVCSLPLWVYLSPLKKLRSLYWEVHKPEYRLRKWGERNKSGKLAQNQCRLGPLTMEAREWLEAQILGLQQEVNDVALRIDRPVVELINAEELDRIHELRRLNTYPDKWSGSPLSPEEFARLIEPFGAFVPQSFNGCEIHGTTKHPKIAADGRIEQLLF